MRPWAAAVRRVPAPAVLGAAAVAAAAAGLSVVPAATSLPPLAVHLAQLALAGAAAFLLDDAAAELTGVVPPPLWRRRAPRLVSGLVVVAASWVVVLLVSPSGPRGALTLEVGVLVVAALAASSVVASRGEPEPGAAVAPAVLLAGLAPLLVGGLLGRAVFLSDAAPAVPPALVTGWAVAGVAAAGVLAATCRDPAGSLQRRVRRAGQRCCQLPVWWWRPAYPRKRSTLSTRKASSTSRTTG